MNQSSWAGGADTGATVTPSTAGSWNKYYSKDSNLSADASGVEVAPASSSSTIDFTTESNYVQEDSGETHISGGKASFIPSLGNLFIDAESVIEDENSPAKSITNNGVTISTAEKKYGASSLYFDGSSSLVLQDLVDWNFGSEDFTVDFWMKSSSASSNCYLSHATSGAWADHGWAIRGNNTINFEIGGPDDGLYNSVVVTNNTWKHIAIVRNGSTFSLYIDGTFAQSFSSSSSARDQSTELNIGDCPMYSQTYTGYLDNVRVVKGTALWTSNFNTSTDLYAYDYSTTPHYITTSDSSQIDSSEFVNVTGISLTQTTPTNTNLKYLVSFDGRSTWKYWDGDSWEVSTLGDLQTNGNSNSELEALSTANWGSTGGFQSGSTTTIDFAVDLSTTDSNATPELDQISVSYEYLPEFADTIDFTTSGNYTLEDSGQLEISGGSAGLLDLSCPSTIQDVESNSYDVSTMGTQCWSENMRTTKYPDGSSIDNSGWTGDDYSCPPNVTNDGQDCSAADELGMFYQWNAAVNGSAGCDGLNESQPACSTPVQGICPTGWHVPSHDEWTALERQVCSDNGGSDCATEFPYDDVSDTNYKGTTGEGSSLSAHAPSTNWDSGTLTSHANFDSSGFDAVPTGYRDSAGTSIINRGEAISFWTSSVDTTKAWSRRLHYTLSGIRRYSLGKTLGYAVRCVRDQAVLGTGYSTTPYYITTTDSSQIDTSSYSEITGASLSQTTPTNTDLKYLVSFDGRSTWKYWDGDSWESSEVRGYTVDQCEGGTAVASGTAYGSPGGAFDNIHDVSQQNYWHGTDLAGSWIYYDFGAGNEKQIEKINIKPSDVGSGAAIKDFDFQGSNDASSWTTIASLTQPNVGQVFSAHTFTNSNSYRYYRIISTSTTYLFNNYIVLYEIEMMERNTDGIPTNGNSKTELEALSSADWSASGGFESGTTTTLDFAVDLSTTDDSATPSLDQISVNYSESLISSKFDSETTKNSMGGLTWDEDTTLPTGSQVSIALRTASSEAGLDSASWSTIGISNGSGTSSGCTKVGATVTCDSTTIPDAMKQGGDDRWFQYKVALSPGTSSPTVTNVNPIYEQDIVAPTITSITSSTSNGSYKEGDTINVTLNFSEATTSSTGLTITLDTGGIVNVPAWTTASSTAEGTYTVGAAHASSDLTVTDITGTITDRPGNAISAGNTTSIPFTTEGNYIQENDSITDILNGEATIGVTTEKGNLFIDGESTIEDDSGSVTTHTFTNNSGVTTSSTRKKYGNESLYFNGSSFFNAVQHDDFVLGTDDFTIDAWINSSDFSGRQIIFSMSNNGGGGRDSTNYFSLEIHNTTGLQITMANSGSTKFVSQGSLTGWTADTWYHIALTRQGSNLYLFRNGELVDTDSTLSGYSLPTTDTVSFGTWEYAGSGNSYMNGYIDNFRLIKGEALWTSGFDTNADLQYGTATAYVTTDDAAQISVSNWDSIDDFTITQTTPANTDLKYLVSFDGRTTWKYWDGDSWEEASTATGYGADQTTGGTASASHDNSYAGWAFDDSGDTLSWGSVMSSDTETSWLQYEFTASKQIQKVRILSNGNSSSWEGIKDFSIKASETGAFSGEETTLYTGQHLFVNSDFIDYTFANSNSYTYYRIVVDSNWLDSLEYSNGAEDRRISEVEMMEPTYSTGLPALQEDGNSKAELEALSQANWESSGGLDLSSDTVDFAVDLSTTDSGATPSLDDIEFEYTTVDSSYTNSTVDPDHTTSNLAVNAALVIDNTDPSSTVSVPDGVQAEYSSLDQLSGTASDNDSFGSVSVSIKDSTLNKYWDGDSWEDAQTWLTGVGSTSWTYDSSSVTWVPDNDYLIQSRATDAAGNEETPGAGETFTFVNSAPTITINTATQSSTVDINYDVSDVESASTTVSLVYNSGATLSSGIDSSSTADITVSDISNFPSSGTILIKSGTGEATRYEYIDYTGTSGSDLTGITRSTNSTLGHAHDSGETVWIKATTVSGDVGTVTNGASKTMTWTATTDTAFYDATQDISVVANDGASANKMGIGTSSTFVFDTVDPVISSVSIDATSVPADLSFSVSDDTSLEMMISLDSGFSGASWESYSSSATATLPTNPDTVYVKFRDSKQNTTADQTITTPETPQSVMVQDVSSVAQDTWRLYSSWQPISAPTPGFDSYRVYRSATLNGTYTEVGSTAQGDINVDYYSDDVNQDDEYYYKIAARDLDDNLSILSGAVNAIANGTQDGGEGGGGGDTTAPTITVGPTVESTTSNSATISWTTNENADSYIEYGTTVSYGSVYGTPDLTTTHSVVLPAELSANTTYHYRVRTRDSSGNLTTSSDGTFDTDAGGDETAPVLSSVSSGSLESNSATITWTTDEASNSYVDIGTSSGSYTDTQGNAEDSTTSHSVDLTNLSAGTTYYYQARSFDSSGNEGISSEESFITTSAPVISSVSNSTPTDNSTTVTFTTGPAAYGYVDYGTSSGSYTMTEGELTTGTSHSIDLEGLTPATTYYYKVRIKDVYGDFTVDGAEHSFVTNADAAPVLSSFTSSTLDNSYAAGSSINITANYSENIDSGSLIVELDTGASVTLDSISGTEISGNYIVSSSQNSTDLSVSAITVQNVCDVDSNCLTGVDLPATNIDDGSDIVIDTAGPVFSSVSPSASSSIDSVTTSSDISYTIDEALASGSITITRTSGNVDASSPHTCTLNGTDLNAGAHANFDTTNCTEGAISLVDGTTYTFTFVGQDALGNSSSQDVTGVEYDLFTAITISSVSSGTPDSDSATITFTTSEAVYGYVDYGTTVSYGKVQGNNTSTTTSHSIILSGLTDETTYHFRPRIKDIEGNYALGDDDTFLTDESSGAPSVDGPTISDVTVSDLTYEGATVTWTTDEDSNSAVTFGETTEYGQTVGDEDVATTAHSVGLNGLSPETLYYYKVVSRNALDNKTEDDNSSSGYTFTTLSGSQDTDNDGEGDQISSVAEEIEEMIDNLSFTEAEVMEAIAELETVSISSSGPDEDVEDNTDVTITWTTNINAKGKVVYKQEDQDDYTTVEETITTSSGYTKNHEVLIKNLNPQTDYEYYVISTSTLGNQVTSDTNTFTTGETPKIYNIAVGTTSLNEAIISWTTNSIETSILEYGTSTKYGKEKEESSSTDESDQSVLLTDLEAGQEYHFRIKGIDEDEETITSSDHTFTTAALPVISNVNVGDVGTESVTVTWETNTNTDSLVEYSFLGEESGTSQGILEAVTNHSIIIENLIPGVSYQATVNSKDQYGNQASSEQFTFTTEEDNNPPQIQDISADTTMYPGEELKIQTVISWITNKDSYSAVAFRQGAGQDGAKIEERLKEIVLEKPEDVSKTSHEDWVIISKPAVTKNHLFVLTDFEPSSVYQYRAVSVDKRGNVVISKDYSFLTPSRRESVFDLIITNFEETFGWVRNLR